MKQKKPLIILSGINLLTKEKMKEWQKDYDKFVVVDLVSTVGVDSSLNNTAECV